MSEMSSAWGEAYVQRETTATFEVGGWTCHVCKRLRPDETIDTVQLRDPRGIGAETSLRYCRDSVVCQELVWACAQSTLMIEDKDLNATEYRLRIVLGNFREIIEENHRGAVSMTQGEILDAFKEAGSRADVVIAGREAREVAAMRKRWARARSLRP